jgi:hypothetical protein
MSNECSDRRARGGAALLLLWAPDRAVREVEGLFTVLLCADCQAARTVGSPVVELPADHDPASRGCIGLCAV